jgi:hypothetical protein
MPTTGTCPDCGAPEGCRTGVYYAGKWRDRRSIDCYERQIKNLTDQLAAAKHDEQVVSAALLAATAELARLREGVAAIVSQIRPPDGIHVIGGYVIGRNTFDELAALAAGEEQ